LDEKMLVGLLESSPYWSLLGMKVRRMEAGYAELVMPFKAELGQLLSFMHGGAVASLLDAAGAVAFFQMLDLEKEVVTTAEMKLNYLNPITLDQKEITACARVVKKGKTLGVSLIEVKNGGGDLFAIGIGTFAIVPRNAQHKSGV
jgi:uncharacterized protein (TIGR00369 family)